MYKFAKNCQNRAWFDKVIAKINGAVFRLVWYVQMPERILPNFGMGAPTAYTTGVLWSRFK